MLEPKELQSSTTVPKTPELAIHAVIDADRTVDGPLQGDDGEAFELVREGDLALVVSESHDGAGEETTQLRRLYREWIRKERSFVPLHVESFESAEAARGFLRGNRETLGAAMEQVGTKVEFEIRFAWDVDDCFEHMSERHAELAQMRVEADSTARGQAAETAMRIGRRYQQLLDVERAQYAEVFAEALGEWVESEQKLDCTNETELLHSRCLIDRAERDAFERRVYQLADEMGDAVVFDLSMPLAPRHFADVDLER